MYKIIFKLLFFILFLNIQTAFCAQEKIDGLEYDVRKLEDAQIEKFVSKNFDIYEVYFENRSDKTFTIPGYSIDLGVDYSTLAEVNNLSKDKSSKKLAIFNIATSAASIALGGIVKRAASTAARSVTSFKHKNNLTEDGFLSENKTYILYPKDEISVFFLLNKSLQQFPQSIRFICHDEDANINYVLINNNLMLREFNADSDSSQNVIAVPNSEQYK